MGEINGKSNWNLFSPPLPPLQCWVCVARSTNPQHCNVGSGGGRGTQNKNVSVSVAMAHWLPDITHVIDGGVWMLWALRKRYQRLHFRFSRLFLPSTDRCQRACIHRNLFLNIIVKQMLNLPATTDDIDKDMAHERVPRRITVPRRVPGTLTMSPSWYVAPHNFYGPYKYDRRHDIHRQDHGQNNSWTVRSQSGLSQVSVRSTVRSQSGLVKTNTKCNVGD